MTDPLTISATITTTIGTLHGLATRLVENIKDGKSATEAKEVLLLVGQLQGHFFTLQQQIIEVQTKCAQLQQSALTANPSNAQKKKDDDEIMPALDEYCTAILKRLAQVKRHGESNSEVDYREMEEVGRAIGLEPLRMEHSANILKDRRLIRLCQGRFEAILCDLTPAGLKYILDHKLNA